MVKRELIESVIYKSIDTIKCRKEYYALIGLSNQVKGAMNRFAKSTRNETIEHGVIIDGQGHTLVEVDGKENGVRIPVRDTITKILEEECKDILDAYQKEYEALNSSEEFVPFSAQLDMQTKYEKMINERIGNLNEQGILFNVDHNHPMLDYSMFTCLSSDDLNNCLSEVIIGANKGIGGFTLHNVIKSITAECGNGTRMTIVNNNPMGQRTVSEDKFNKARDNLINKWDDYSIVIQNDALQYAKSLVGKYSESDVKRDRKDLNTEIGKDVNNYIKKRSLEIFPNMIKGNINEFEELGFELRVDWL